MYKIKHLHNSRWHGILRVFVAVVTIALSPAFLHAEFAGNEPVQNDNTLKIPEAELAYENIVAQIYYNLGYAAQLTDEGGALLHTRITRVEIEPFARQLAIQNPDGAVEFLLGRLKNDNNVSNVSMDIAAACLGSMASVDPEAIRAVEELLLEKDYKSIYAAITALNYMPIENRQDIAVQWLNRCVETELHANETLHHFWIAINAAAASGSSDAAIIIEDLLDTQEHFTEDGKTRIRNALAYLQTFEGMDSEQIEKESRYREVLSIAGSTKPGLHVKDDDIWSNAKRVHNANLLQFDNRELQDELRVPTEVLLTFVDGSRPYANDQEVCGAIALLALRHEKQAVPFLVKIADNEKTITSIVAKQALSNY